MCAILARGERRSSPRPVALISIRLRTATPPFIYTKSVDSVTCYRMPRGQNRGYRRIKLHKFDGIILSGCRPWPDAGSSALHF